MNKPKVLKVEVDNNQVKVEPDPYPTLNIFHKEKLKWKAPKKYKLFVQFIDKSPFDKDKVNYYIEEDDEGDDLSPLPDATESGKETEYYYRLLVMNSKKEWLTYPEITIASTPKIIVKNEGPIHGGG